jgi:lipoprotein NlpD
VKHRRRYIVAAALLVMAARAHAVEPPRPAVTVAPSRVHTVARGDTLSGIAARYGVTVRALAAANRLPNAHAPLRIGQRLSVPSVTVKTPRSPSFPRPSGALASAASGRRTGQAARACCRAAPCCGPRGLMLSVPEWVELSPLFAWPVEGAVTSPFGRRRSGWHRGIDIKAERGEVVFAAARGVVMVSDREPRYGRVVKIEHEGGFVTVYAHNEENLVEPGVRVEAGDPIATIGRTGRATTDHLHFEIRRNGAVYNPLYLLPLPPRVGQVEDSGEVEEEHD